MEGVNGIGLGTHLLIFGALVVNLWFAGDLVEAVTTHQVRGLFELTLILGWLWFVIECRYRCRAANAGASVASYSANSTTSDVRPRSVTDAKARRCSARS